MKNYKKNDKVTINNPTHEEFLNFLDNNPSNPTEERKEITKAQQEAIWQADWNACQRLQNEENAFHL